MATGPAIALVDAFTRRPGQGNRAGVVLDADGLPEEALQRIAAAVNVSETAFVTRAAGVDFALRWFTPTSEVPFCGHGTVATLHRLAEVGRLARGQRVAFQCRAGRLDAEIAADAGGSPRVWSATPAPAWGPLPVAPERLAELLGAGVDDFDAGVPARANRGTVFVPIRDRATLMGLRPQLAAIRLEQALGLEGICAFARDPIEPDHAAISRYFVPAHGIDEDPVTGSTNGPLAALLAEAGAVAMPVAGGTVRVRMEQGDGMGRAGRVDVELTGTPRGVTGIRIGSEAVTVLVGTLA
jgi:PhzF family phenazine biosynthesis protein